MATKQIISREELNEKLQGLLASYPQCRDISIRGVTVLVEQFDGANWHIDWIGRSGPDTDWPECSEAILQEVRNLRSAYDVKLD